MTNKFYSLEELRAFSQTPMPYFERYGHTDTRRKAAMREAQAALPDQIEITKDLASALFTAHVDNQMKKQKIDKRYNLGMSMVTFSGSTLFAIISGTFGIHTVGHAYEVYKKSREMNRELETTLDSTAEKILNSYRLEYISNKFVLIHGEIKDSQPTFTVNGFPVGGDMAMSNVGVGETITKSSLADSLYKSPELGI